MSLLLLFSGGSGSGASAPTFPARNLLIAVPQITTDITAPIGGVSASDERARGYNVISGPRRTFTQLATAAGEYSLDFDTGASLSRNIDFFILARADILYGQGCDQVRLYGSNDGSSWTEIVGTTDLQNATRWGPQFQDLLFSEDHVYYDSGALPNDDSYQYYRVKVAVPSGTASMRYSKAYFGAWFDMGNDPAEIQVTRDLVSAAQVETSAGSVSLFRSASPGYRVSVRWEMISDANTEAFFSEVAAIQSRHPGLFLVTRTDHTVLDNHRILHCRLTSCSSSLMRQEGGYNVVEATFEEMPS